MTELIDKYRRLFERNGYLFEYAKTYNDFHSAYQHHFRTSYPKGTTIVLAKNICRQSVISDNEQYVKDSLDRLLFDTAHGDTNFKFTFKEDVVLKILSKIDEHIR